MAQKLSFASGGTSSWADDDDIDFQPLSIAPKVAQTEAPQPIEEEEIHHHEQEREERPRSPRRRDDDRRGYQDDRRGYQEDRRGGYGDRRGGYDDRRGGYEERRRGSREDRPKTPVPDVGPWKLYVGNLSFRLTEDDVADFIGPEGIKDIRFPRDYDNRPKGFAYVEFVDKEYLVRALDLDGRDFDGRRVKMDVAVDRERKPRDSGFYDKRNDRSGDRSRESNENPRERRHLTLLPRSTSTEKKDPNSAPKPSIFGDAKPRDESAYLERKKALDQERKAKAKEEKETKAKAKAKAEKASAAEAAVLSRKGSRDEGARAGGRGRADRRPEGGRGRGAPKENVPPASGRKAEPRSKRSEPPTTKISAPAPAKTANVFDLLDDSDSDSD
ncbi:Eukaryotic translation initiation factor 4B [Phytophthora boehmeriae]|uniref:Eukaryotic translation initiation factor 4B n=1 Tax=Phytophthora boehmeriae TaxID=109152 RepID=A0A8T1WZW9_9STRA|nr:Eukaryotic translation initiation factor 4B [Phytophthora boehmeriae]